MALVFAHLAVANATVAAPPRALETTEPKIDAEALAPGEDRTVILHVHIGVDGQVVHSEVHAGAGEPFDSAAIDAVQAWVFAPATDQNGEAMEVVAEIPIHFHRPFELHDEETSEHVAPAHGHAHEATPAVESVEDEGAPADPAHPVGSTVVRDRVRKAPTSTSDFDIDIGQLRDVPRQSATDFMTLAPGVLLVNHGGEGHAPSIFLRGFDAGEGKDVEFLFGGIPLNDPSNAHGHGYADTYFIIPELVDNLRVIEGPFDPAQGDFAVAGTTAFGLGQKRRGLHTGVSYGMFNSFRLVGTYAPPSLSDKTFAGVLIRRGDGYGKNRAYLNGTAMGQYEGALFGDARIRVLGALAANRYSSAGVLRQDDFLARALPCDDDAWSQFYCTNDATQGGSSQRALGLAEVTLKLGRGRFAQSVFGTYKNMRVRENFTGFVTDIRDDGAPQRGDAQDLITNGFMVGGESTYVLKHRLLGAPVQTDLGFRVKHDHVLSEGLRLRSETIVPYDTAFSALVDMTTLAPYATVRIKPLPFVRFVAGVRGVVFIYNNVDQNRPLEDREGTRLPRQVSEAFGGTVMPRGAVEFEPLDNLVFSASAGLGARSSDGAALSDGEAAPLANVFSTEMGGRYAFSRGAFVGTGYTLSVRSAAFFTRVSQDLVFDPEAGRNETVGASNRMGAYVQGRFSWASFLDLNTSVAYSEAFLPDADAPIYALTAGPRLPYVPRLMSRTDVSINEHVTLWGETIRLRTGLGATLVAPKPLPLETFSEPILLADTQVSIGWRFVDVSVVVDNVLDARFRQQEFNYVSNFKGADVPPSLIPQRHFSAGPPRSARLTLDFHLEDLDVFSW